MRSDSEKSRPRVNFTSTTLDKTTPYRGLGFLLYFKMRGSTGFTARYSCIRALQPALYNLTPGARARQPRTDGPLPPYSPRRRAQIAPPRSNGAGAAAPRPRHRSGAAPRLAWGRCPPRRPPKAAKTGQTGLATARTDAPEKRLGALRPGLRRQRGANWVPSARWGLSWGVRLASWHRASSARGFYVLF
jgi:hypothetical protein